jgi:hypothetical protein
MASIQRESNGICGFWQMKNHTLAGKFGFVGNKMAFTMGKLLRLKAILLLTKAMKTLPI